MHNECQSWTSNCYATRSRAFVTLIESNDVMDKRTWIRHHKVTVMTYKAQRHFQSVALLSGLDRAERYATFEQFASAAKIAARSISNARNRSREFRRLLKDLMSFQLRE